MAEPVKKVDAFWFELKCGHRIKYYKPFPSVGEALTCGYCGRPTRVIRKIKPKPLPTLAIKTDNE